MTESGIDGDDAGRIGDHRDDTLQSAGRNLLDVRETSSDLGRALHFCRAVCEKLHVEAGCAAALGNAAPAFDRPGLGGPACAMDQDNSITDPRTDAGIDEIRHQSGIGRGRRHRIAQRLREQFSNSRDHVLGFGDVVADLIEPGCHALARTALGKAVARRDAGKHSDKRAFHEPLRVDQQVIAAAAQRRNGLLHLGEGLARLLLHAADRQGNDVAHAGMKAGQRREGLIDDPIDFQAGNGAHGVRHRRIGVNDIAERRQFDEKDAHHDPAAGSASAME
jgi:hypothetical protein